jgi:hypothetical protein
MEEYIFLSKSSVVVVVCTSALVGALAMAKMVDLSGLR